jgi:hypothetical protein
MANIVDINQLREYLQGETPVAFSYKKVNGETREVLGSLNPNLIPGQFKPKDSSRNTGPNLRYFDLEKEAWRSLQADASTIWA